jgi:alpha-1,2-mannosyltransferase
MPYYRIDQERHSRVFLYSCLLFALSLFMSGYVAFFLGCYWIIAGILKNPGVTDLMGHPVGHDFVAFWAASELARHGDPVSIYSLAKMHLVEQAVIGAKIQPWAWNYPPTFLLMVLPLSLAPYAFSYATWIVGTLCGYLGVIRRIAPHRLTPFLFLGFPGVYANFFYGQNGFLSTMFLGGGLLLIDTHPFWGGALLGLMSYRPQLGVLIPVALVAGRRWQALLGATVATVGIALVSLLVFGSNIWTAFWHNLHFASGLMDTEIFWRKMPTIFAAARLTGLNYHQAILVQGGAAMGVAGAVAWTWYRDQPLVLRASVLVTGTFLATPYAFEYDLALLGIAFAWLGWQEYQLGRTNGQAFLMVCWMAFYLIYIASVSQVCPFILLAVLIFSLSRGLRSFLAEGNRLAATKR